MKIATLNKGKETKYFNGYPLIEEEDIYSQDHLKEGDIFQIVTDKSQYVATAYVGRQHKGLGWVLTYDKAQEINTAFFVKLFNTALAERDYYFNIDGTNALDYLMLKVMELGINDRQLRWSFVDSMVLKRYL